MAAPAPKHLSEAQRSAILDNRLMELASTGEVRIETRMPTWAVVVGGRPVNSVAHILATIFMCGLWLPFWIYAEHTGGEQRKTIKVDERGLIHESSPAGQNQRSGPPADRIMAYIGLGLLAIFLIVVLIRRLFA